MPSASWSPTVSGPEDDFSNFLEFSDLQLDFSSLDDNPHNGENIQADGDPMDVRNNAIDDLLEFRQLGDSSATTGFNEPIEVFPDIQMQSQQLDKHLSQHLTYGHPFAAHNGVPPTPNSMEIHGSQAQYNHALSDVHPQVTYAHPRHTHDGQVSCLMSLQRTGTDGLQDLYTPLVSPAVTPHDSHFQRAEYTIAGDCFSPLTSPALEAQSQHSQRNVFEDIRSLDTCRSIPASDIPIDPSLSTPASKVAKKPNRRASAASRTPSRVVKQSPLMKAQARRRQTSGANIPPNKVSGLIEDAETSKPAAVGRAAVRGNLPLSNSLESSEAESISPEPLSEILMPPPATPKSSSASKSPHLIANKNGQPSTPLPVVDNQPATPASLMRIRKGNGKVAGSTLREQSSVLDLDEEHAAKETAQTEAAKTRRGPALTPIKTTDAQDGDSTPTIPARKNPKVNPTSAPATATASVQPSPQFDATSTSGGPTDSTGTGRTAKKRTSSSSVQVSPALRPRISPSIKPLLPEGGK